MDKRVARIGRRVGKTVAHMRKAMMEIHPDRSHGCTACANATTALTQGYAQAREAKRLTSLTVGR